jgi:hypothetical protein
MYARGHKTLVANQRLLVGDTTRALIAAPGAGYRLVIMKINYQVITSAAQSVDVGVSGGGVTKQVLSLPVSPTGVNGTNLGDQGFALDTNVALTALASGAGNVIQFQVEYFQERVDIGG